MSEDLNKDAPLETHPDGVHVDSADGQKAVDEVAAAAARDGAPGAVRDEINKVLGKEYDSDESALKAVKELNSLAGKKGQEAGELQAKVNELSQAGADDARLKAVEDELFYTKHPEYADLKPVIDKMGTNPSEVVASEEFKGVFEKVQGYNESQATKSVLESNPRLGIVRDKMKAARDGVSEARKIAHQDPAGAEAALTQAGHSAIDSVLDAYED